MAEEAPKEAVKPEEGKKAKPHRHEQAMCEFYDKPFLTDFGLVNPSNNIPIKVHKVILATGSQYYLKILKEEWDKEQKADKAPDAKRIEQLEIPKPYPTAFDQDG